MSVSVTPTAADPTATISVNDSPVDSASSSNPVSLEVGENSIAIVVRAEDGVTQRTYLVDVTRLDNDATLASLSLSPGSIDQVFQPAQYSYTADVGFLDAAVSVTAVTASSRASITVDGQAVNSGVPSQDVVLEEGTNSISVDVTADDGVTTQTYELSVTRAPAGEWAGQVFQQAYVKASNSETSDGFGRSVSVSGNTLVVGTILEDSSARGVNGNQADNNAPYAGAVYVFVRDVNGLWTQEAYLKASNADGSDNFGESVSISGDTLVVGAVNEDGGTSGIDGNQFDNSKDDAGAVYVYVRSGNTWTQQAYIKPSNMDTGDGFGARVALWGDTLAVSAIREDSGSTNPTDNSADNAGAVYVFSRDATDAWSQTAYLKAENPIPQAGFGRSLAIYQDTLAVGASGEAESNGAGYIFSNASGNWMRVARFTPTGPGTGTSNGMGYSAAVHEDTVAFGAIDGSPGGPGRVFLYRKEAEGIWHAEAVLTAFNADSSDHFGISVGLASGYLAVGAWRESSDARGINGDGTNNDATESGAAYLYSRAQDGSWKGVAYLKSSNSDSNDRFGSFLFLDGSTLAITAPFEASAAQGIGGNQADNNAIFSGATYVFTY